MTTLKNITRHLTSLDHEAGWYVRMRSLGKHKRRYFSDQKYGDKAKSLDAAVKYRDGLAKTKRDGRFKTL